MFFFFSIFYSVDWIPFSYDTGWKLLLGDKLDNCRSHLVCFPFLRNNILVLPGVQYVRIIFLYILSRNLVIKGRKIIQSLLIHYGKKWESFVLLLLIFSCSFIYLVGEEQRDRMIENSNLCYQLRA